MYSGTYNELVLMFLGVAIIISYIYMYIYIYICIYNIFTINRMCYKIYSICDINNNKYNGFIYYSGNVTYTIFTYTFAPI